VGARAYAEDTLGVHDVYEQAQEAHGSLESALDAYAAQASIIRSTHDAIEQREYELASALKAYDPSMSQEALKRALRDAQRTDDELVSLRIALHSAQAEQEKAHALVETNKYRLRYLSARLNELGGLLAYYASVKMGSRPSPAATQPTD
jgi:predicted  nucleic acid-binding Zn-ribbon protein